MRKVACLALLLFLLAGRALAEIPCLCGLEDCLCFIRLGDEGRPVAFLQAILIQRGYFTAEDISPLFDETVLTAVQDFQRDNCLPPTGLMDDETLTILIWGMTPAELDTLQPWSIGQPVWIPTDGGVRQHSDPYCCDMHDPRLVSYRNAIAMGMYPCGHCHPNGNNSILEYEFGR